MAGISIDFVADVSKFIGRTKDVEGALEDVSSSLDDMAKDAVRAGQEAEDGLARIEADEAVRELRRLADEARDSGSDLEKYFTAAADTVEAEVKALSRDAERHLEDIGDAARDAGDDIDKGITQGTKDAEGEAEKLERSFKDTFDTVKRESKGVGDDIGRSTKKGFGDATRNTETFRDEARQNLSESVSSFRGDVEDIPQLLQDVLGGVSSDLSAVGGLAAAGVAAAIGVTIAKMQELADKINERKEEMGDLAQEIADVDGNLAEVDFQGQMREWAFAIQDARSWFEVWQDDAVNNLENVARAAEEAGVPMAQFWEAMTSRDASEAEAQLEAMRERLDEVRGAQNDLHNSNMVLDESEQALSESYSNEIRGLQDLIPALEEQAEKKKDAYDQSVTLRAAEEGVTEAVIRTRDALTEANSAIEENNDLKREAADAAGNAFLAEGDYAGAVEDATAKIKENGEGLDVNTDKGRANREALVKLAESGRAYADTMADAGRDQEEVNGILEDARTDFLNAAEAAGMGADEANRLADELGLVPGQVTATVNVNGVSEALDRVGALNRQLNLADGKVSTAYVRTLTMGQGEMNSGGTVPENTRPKKAASGTYVTGEGSDIEDRVPYMLSPGESVLDAQTTEQLGGPGIIDILNNGQPVAGVQAPRADPAADSNGLAFAIGQEIVRALRTAPLQVSVDGQNMAAAQRRFDRSLR